MFRPAAQLTSTVMGAGVAAGEGARLKRNRLPSGETWHEERTPPGTYGEQPSDAADLERGTLSIDRRDHQGISRVAASGRRLLPVRTPGEAVCRHSLTPATCQAPLRPDPRMAPRKSRSRFDSRTGYVTQRPSGENVPTARGKRATREQEWSSCSPASGSTQTSPPEATSV